MKFVNKGNGLELFKDPIQSFGDMANEYAKEALIEGLKALGEIIVELSGAIGLVGAGLMIIMQVAGYKDGNKWAGSLFVLSILIKYILGDLL